MRRVALLLPIVAIVLIGAWLFRSPPQPVRIGVLHSLSGTMAVSEAPLVDALTLAVEDINAAGGILGRPIETVVADCRSDWNHCAAEAERLIAKEHVQALFGCWTSACRKAVKPVVERHRHLLFYPLQYEGLEQSPNIVYLGASPNQQIIPATLWAMGNLGRRVYLVGSDYLFPRTANLIIKDLLAMKGGQVLAERYLPLGASELHAVAAEIARLRPDVVLNTINGDSNVHFFKALRDAGLDARQVPVVSFSIAEPELAATEPGLMAGHYAAWSYFQGLDNPQNKAFVEAFKARFGTGRVVGDPMEASHIGLHLWAQAANEAGSTEPQAVQTALLRQSLDAPEGVVALDRDTRHLWKTSRIGRAQADGQFVIVWHSGQPIQPRPFPTYQPRQDWLQRTEALEATP